MILDAGEFSRAVRRQERTQILQDQIMTYIAVEIALGRVTGKSFLCTPDLFA